MKKFSLFILFIVLSMAAHAQFNVRFHEDFDLPSMGDSIVSTQEAIVGQDDWGSNTRLHAGNGSLRCDSCQVKIGNTTYLTTQPFSTLGNAYILLSFSQICKVDPLDGCYIQVSNDGGLSWIQLTGGNYVNNVTLLSPGAGAFANVGNKFMSSSYGASWSPASPATLPQNTWWRQETFDVSMLLGNCPNARVRFKLTDGGTPGPGGNPPNIYNNRGWYIDDVFVKGKFSELTAPLINLINPFYSGNTYVAGPYSVGARGTDASGISAMNLVYTVSNGPNDTLPMVYQASDSSWRANLPALADSAQLCYWVIGYDASPAHNFGSTLSAGPCVSLVYYAPCSLPLLHNFDISGELWLAGPVSSGSQWEWGTPAFGLTNSAHSPAKCWDVNLNAAYTNNALCTLTSPAIDFSTAIDPTLSFWFNFKTQSNYDGFNLQYTLDEGLVWNVLGSGPIPSPDSLGINWYTTNNLDFTGQAAWEGNSGGWKQARYQLSAFSLQPATVRFRFVFRSNGWTFSDGVSIDDFEILTASLQDAAAEDIMTPNSGCGLGQEFVQLKLRNAGLDSIAGFTASYKRDALSQTVSEVVALPTALPPGQYFLYTFSTPVNLATVGVDKNFNLKAWVSLPNDLIKGNDTTYHTLVSRYVPNPPVVADQAIINATSTTLTATSSLPISWYDALTGGSVIVFGPTYTTPILYWDTVFYAGVTAPNGCASVRAPDTVFVSPLQDFDGAVLAITSPQTGFSLELPPADSVRVVLRNAGIQSLSNFVVKFSLSGPIPTVVESATYTDSIPSLSNANYTFPVPAVFSAIGNYVIKAWVEVLGDTKHLNDTASLNVENIFPVYCTSAATDPYTPHELNIGNVTLNNLNNGVATPTLYNINSLNNYTDFSNLPAIQLTREHLYSFSLSVIFGELAYKAYAKVFVDWNYNGTFEAATETACTLSFPTTGPFTATANLNVPANAHLGLTRLRVVLQDAYSAFSVNPCGTYADGETEDYIVNILPYQPLDVGISKIVSPEPGCLPTGIHPLIVRVKNYGAFPVEHIPVHAPGGDFVIPDTLQPGDSIDISVGALNFPNAGIYNYTVHTDLSGDTTFGNNAFPFVISTPPEPADAIYGPSNFCATSLVKTYSVSPIGQATTYDWSLPPGATMLSGGGSSVNIQFDPAFSTGTISVRGHNDCGYGNASQMAITMYALPIVNAGPDQTIDSGNVVNLYAAVSSGTMPYMYLWSTGAGTPTITVSPAQTTTYVVAVMDAHNCPGMDTIRVKIVIPDFLVTTVPSLNVCNGNVIIPITVNHFDAVASASLSLKFNDTILDYLSYQNANPALSQGTLIVNSNAGKVQIAWYSVVPATIDSGLLLELVFSGVNGFSELSWNHFVQAACQFTDLDELNIKAIYEDGGLLISDCGSISGTVLYDNALASPLSPAVVKAKQGGTVVKQVNTNSQGGFLIPGLYNGTYEVSAQTTKDWGGANSADALIIMKYFTGITPLSALRAGAADVNASGSVNTTDALLVGRRFVHLVPSFASGDWYITKDTALVFNNDVTVNLKAVCYGDVNGSYTPGAKEGRPPLLLCEGVINAEGDRQVNIPIHSQQELTLSSLSFILSFPAENLSISRVSMETTGTLLFHVEGSQLRLSWYSLEPLVLHSGDPLMVLHCEILHPETNIQPGFELEAGTQLTDFNGQELPDLTLSYPAILLNQDMPWLGQNIPNPASTSTKIPFYLPADAHVSILLRDLLGRQILVLADADVSQGQHEARLDLSGIKPGIYMYQMVVQDKDTYRSLVKKMTIE